MNYTFPRLPLPYLTRVLILSLLSLGLSRCHGVDGRVHGDACTTNLDCLDTKWCNPTRKECDCLELTIPKVSTIQIYHSLKRSCFSPAGSMCFMGEKTLGTQYHLTCVPHANCVRHEKVSHLSSKFGLCFCAPGYVQDDNNRLCEKEEEKTIELDLDMDLGDIYSRFNGRTGMGQSEDDGEPRSAVRPKAEMVKDDKSNENINFWIPEHKQEKLARPDSSGRLIQGNLFFTTLAVGVMLWI